MKGYNQQQTYDQSVLQYYDFCFFRLAHSGGSILAASFLLEFFHVEAALLSVLSVLSVSFNVLSALSFFSFQKKFSVFLRSSP